MILILGCIVCNICVLTLSLNITMPKIMACVAILACISATYYMLRGFKKYAAPAYTAYMMFCAIFCRLCTIGMAVRFGGIENELLTAALVGGNTVLFGAYLVLSIAKDIGKKNSFNACGLILVIVSFFMLQL